jgi:hypothetical protein
MTTDLRYVIWRLIFKSKPPPPQWRRKRRGVAEYCAGLLGVKKKHSAQSLSIRKF